MNAVAVAPDGADWLREAREQALLSTSDLARELGVSRTLVSLWESGQRPVRTPETVVTVLDRAGRPLEQLLRGVLDAGPAGLTEPEALAISPRLRRQHLDQLAAERLELVTWAKASRLDPRGRPYLPRVLIAADQAVSEPASDSGLSAAHVHGLRLVHGWTREQLARQLGVTPVTVAQWERAERPVPPARVDEVRSLLLTEVYGSTLRNARVRLGIGQAELARRLGVSAPMLNGWESGKRSPTRAAGGRGVRAGGPDKLLHFAEVFAAAHSEPTVSPIDEAWTLLQGLLDAAGADGLGAVELEQRAQRGRRGQGDSERTRSAAIQRARRLGLLAYVDVFVPTKGNGRRAVKRYVLPQHLDEQRPAVAMAPDELDRRLEAARWTNKRLATELGVSPATVTLWRNGRGASGVWAERVRELLPALAPADEDAVAAARRRLLAAIGPHSEGRREVYQAAGYGKDNRVAGQALEQLLAEERVHWLELTSTNPGGGRNRRVLRPGAADVLTGEQARQLRRKLGLPQVALGEQLGVSGPLVSIWESRGDRLIPSNRSAELLALQAARRRG